MLKGLLLLKDFAAYSGEARGRRRFGQRITLLAEETSRAFGLKPMKDSLKAQMTAIEEYYKNHLLRYGSLADAFVDPRSIEVDQIERRIAAAIRLSDRETQRYAERFGCGEIE